MIVYDQFPQYSPEWWAVRRGVPTASEFHRIITAAKAEFAAGHKSYVNDLIGDELDGEYPRLNDGATVAMKRGTVLEPEARGLYEVWAGAPIRQVAFCTTDCGRFGCSPDSLVGAEGVLEMKCPMPNTFAGYVIDDVLPADYRAQCHGHLIVTGARWCDFMAYLPGKEPFIKRVTPDEFTEKLRACLIRFDDVYRKARDRFKLANPMLPLSILAKPAVTPAAVTYSPDTHPSHDWPATGAVNRCTRCGAYRNLSSGFQPCPVPAGTAGDRLIEQAAAGLFREAP